MNSPLGKQSRVTIDDLCTATEDRARALGHRLGAWEDVREEGATGRRASCTACGCAAYVRIEGGLLGAAGRAHTEPCPRRR